MNFILTLFPLTFSGSNNFKLFSWYIQSRVPKQMSISKGNLFLLRISLMGSFVLVCGKQNIWQITFQLFGWRAQHALKQFMYARFYSGERPNRDPSPKSNIFYPINLRLTRSEGVGWYQVTLRATFTHHEFFEIYYHAFMLVSQSPNCIPAGDTRINFQMQSGYFSAQHVAIYPPKECPTKVIFSSLRAAFLHCSMASIKQLMVSLRLQSLKNIFREDSPIPR